MHYGCTGQLVWSVATWPCDSRRKDEEAGMHGALGGSEDTGDRVDRWTQKRKRVGLRSPGRPGCVAASRWTGSRAVHYGGAMFLCT
ncbi:hypothetical protein E2562_025112 [Oryza meyeriana var. granulata]|uniref:Uncharacterized protein n=1 Tax=Oryza meyeriana var. granulata TaxID=110450 RepID=A0A6G1CIL5_9ORYZ|nr:hypothetical protein E2562_025112 [Oryza meyeriana var. granulata]